VAIESSWDSIRAGLRVLVPEQLRRAWFDVREFAREGMDWAALTRRIPPLSTFRASAAGSAAELRPLYQEYVTDVSAPYMAISLDLAVLLTVLCEALRPQSILDLGSGFSSVVFRRHAMSRGPGITVWSVDDSEEWLGRTGRFLSRHGLAADNLVGYDLLLRDNNAQFDLVLHDLGTMDVRARTLAEAIARTRSGGVIVLDDVHKQPYASLAKRALAREGMTPYSLRRVTEDDISRYSLLAFR